MALTLLRHIKALLKKNALLCRARKLTTIAQIVMPSVLVIVLSIASKAFPRPEAIRNPMPVSIQRVQKCTDCSISTIIFAPERRNDTRVDAIVQSFLTNNNLDWADTRSIPCLASAYDGCAQALSDYLVKNPNTTAAAVTFGFGETGGVQTRLFLNHTKNGTELQAFQVAFEEAIIQQAPPYNSTFRINAKVRDFPTLGRAFDPNAVGLQSFGVILFYLASMVQFMVTLVTLVEEKENKLRLGMALMGMSQSAFWTHWAIWGIGMFTTANLLLFAVSAMFQLDLVLNVNFLIIFLLFFLYGLSMMALAFFMSTLISRQRTANILGFIIVALGMVLMSFFGNPIALYSWYDPTTTSVPRTIFQILMPMFNFAKGFHDIIRVAIKTVNALGELQKGRGFWWADLYTFPVDGADGQLSSLGFAPAPTNEAFLWLLFNTALYLLLALYFDSVTASDVGLGRSWYFFVTPEFWGCSASRPHPTKPAPEFLAELDSDVAAQVANVFDSEANNEDVVVMNMTKDYQAPGPFATKRRAVHGVSFTIPKGSLFALLGHNGAGKTTTINMLIGLFPPTEGDAIVCGHSVANSRDKVGEILGVCPQHDILWDDLTGRQHLEIFGQFCGVHISAEEIDRSLAEVSLSEAGNKPTKTYSGGMKRRLSVIVANIGQPKVIVLDEPTTGMDPHSKREVWLLIEKLKHTSTVLLTTHSMEEADALADSIGIMAKGQLRCCAGSLSLKRKFGKGYQIKMISKEGVDTKVDEWFKQVCPNATKVAQNAGSHIYHLDKQQLMDLPPLIKELENMADKKDEYNQQENQSGLFKDWGISQTTLEDVYLEINSKYNVNESEVRAPGSPRSVLDGGIIPGSPHSITMEPQGKEWVPTEDGVVSYPWRALVRKQLSQQRRRPGALCCFISLPIVMVLFCAIIDIIADRIVPETVGVLVRPPPVDVTSPCAFSPFSRESKNVDKDAQKITPPSGPEPTNLIKCHLSPSTAAWLYMSGLPEYIGLDPSLGGSSNVAPEGLAHQFLLQTIGGSDFAAASLQGTPPRLGSYNSTTNRFTPVTQESLISAFYPYIVHGNDTKAIDDDLTAIQALVRNEGYKNKPAGTGPRGSSYLQGLKNFSSLPVGAYEFESIGDNVWNYTVRAGVGDKNFNWYALPPSLATRATNFSQDFMVQSTLISMMNTAMYRHFTGNVTSLTTHISAMPRIDDDQRLSVAERVGTFMFPIVYLFPMPMFLYALVYEKEFRFREVQKLNGLKMVHYWATTYLFNFIIFMCIITVFWIMLAIFQIRWLTQTAFGYILFLSVAQGLNTGAVSIFLSTFTSSSVAAGTVGFLLTFVLWISGVIIELVVESDKPAPIYMMIGPYACIHGLVRSIQACSRGCVTAAQITNVHYLGSIVWLLLTTPIYFFLGLYLNSVLPSKWGVPKHPCFCCINKSSHEDKLVKVSDTESNGHEIETDVAEEAAKVNAGSCDGQPVLIKKLNKVYSNGFVAVEKLSLSVPTNQIMGLLGPNGAGKTTTISMLCGMFGPTRGTALLAGHSIINEINKVHLTIGLCPQHDILWKDHLTCEEHLLFYARLKGIPPHAEADHVTYWLSKVSLLMKRKALPNAMSGGEQRRLSIAIAFVGSPRIVMLDEPTTGLDPTIRRQIWDLVMECKQGRSIILTTHSMEEAEVLSDRIGIMARGNLQCLGSPMHLKSKFGKGMRISISYHEENTAKAMAFIKQLNPLATLVGAPMKGGCTFEMVSSESVADIFNEVALRGREHGIEDWGLAQANLEDVFLQIVNMTNRVQATQHTIRDKHINDEMGTKALPTVIEV